MDLITFAREFGSAIQNNDLYINFKIAEQNVQCDEEFQKMNSNFNNQKDEINKEIMKENIDQSKIDKLNAEIGELYGKISENENMKRLNKIKIEFQNLMQKINFVLVKSTEGEDPMSIDVDQLNFSTGCSGSCSSCSGC